MEDNICQPDEQNGLCDFCGSPNLWPVFSVESVSSNIAVLPSCLWQIILSIVPLVWSLVALPFFISDIRKKRRNSLKWSITHGIKIISGVAFLAAPIVQLILLFQQADKPDGREVLPGQILSNVALALSGFIIVIMTELLRRHGAITSGTITIFWAFGTAGFWFFFTTIYAYSSNYEIEQSFYDLDASYKDSELANQTFIIFTVQCAIVTINFILSWFPEKLPVEYDDGSYESSISWCNSMVYSWLTQLISVGYKKAKTGDKKGLTEDDVKNVKARDQTINRYAEFKQNWQAELDRIAQLNAKNEAKKKKTNKVASEKSESGDEVDDSIKPSLYRVLFATFSHEIFVTAGWKLANDVMVFFSPQIIKQVLAFIDELPDNALECKDTSIDSPPPCRYATPPWLGYLFSVLLFIVSCGVTFVLQRYWYHTSRVGTQIRCVLSAAIYEKALKVNFSNHGATVGEVVNYMSIDTQKFQDTMSFINMIWSAPLQIILSLVFLYNEIEWASFMALGVFVLVAPLSTVFGGKIRMYIGLMMKQKDSRIKVMNELLSGIKVLKLYAWEIPFMKKVNAIREKELGLIKMNALYQAVVIFVWEITPYLVQLVCFAVYMQIPGADLTAPVVYTSISLFNILRFPINMLPMVTIMIITLRVANDRIVKFLYSEELDQQYLTRGPNTDKSALQITKSDYDWKKGGSKALENFEMEVKKGNICAVVGPVGCGKSAMISGLLGELHSKTGRIAINGNVAYVSQQAWIQNMTLKDNILFGNDLDEKKYQKVIDVCCLQSDLDILDEGDQTEIGEKGINLSGGQKQRVAIARAVYAEADIYVFDDPLSAVDAHVGRAIFDRVLGRNGLLSDKTRLLVTHSTQYLPDCDDIVVMDNGGIVLAHGNLGELKALKDKRIEQIISVKEKDKNAEKDKDENKEKQTKSEAKTGNKKDGKLVQKEKAEEGGVKGSIFMSYFKACGWHWVLIYIVWALIYQAADLMYNIWLSIWVDAIPFYSNLQGSSDPDSPPCTSNVDEISDDLPKCDCGYGVPGQYAFKNCYGDAFYLGIYGAIGVSVGIFSFTKSISMLQAIIKSARTFHSSVLNGVMRSPMSFFDTTPSGRIVNRFGKDLDAIDMTIPQSVRQWISCLFRIIGTLVVLGRTNVWFLLVMPPLFLLFFVIERYFIAANRQVKRLESTTRSPIYSSFSETISGSSLIRAYKAEQRFIADNFGRVDFNLKFQYASLMCNRWLGMRLECFANLITFSVAIYAVASRGQDAASAATMGLALTYAQSITQILNFLIRVTAELEVNLVAVERLTEYGQLESEAEWRGKGGDEKPSAKWMQKGVVDFDKYSLRYRDGLPLVLKNIICQIKDGEKVGIVGRTGAGKSSLTVGMFRLVEPASGRVIIDKKNTDQMGLHDLREELTIIPQEPVLFSGTLRENLDPFGNFKDDQLWQAVKQAHLEATVNDFEKKLEHEIAENGSNLSVGERQLVCLARALLRRSKVLIMDEATSAVDNNTDNLIQSTIRTEFAKMTVLTIAHRLNTIVDYDRVAVLDKGQIAEFESPLTLYKQGGIFASMCKEANLNENDIIELKKGNKLSNVLEDTQPKDDKVESDDKQGVENEAYLSTDF